MSSNIPLAERVRPIDLEHYIGQSHLVGEGAVLRTMIEANNIPSMVLWGPPGVGKTTLAKIIANKLDRPFFELSAISSGVKDVREVIDKAKRSQFFDAPNPILFIDEIHRFSKSQQDSLLGAVENGTITLIGATTENPSFEIISPLLSRCQVYVLKHLEKDDLVRLVNLTLSTDLALSKREVVVEEYESMLRYSGGDARKLLNILELMVKSSGEGVITITNESVTSRLQDSISSYDKKGEMHYDVISAFIKSVRGGDPDAAVYYLARMLSGGEDVKFICRRLIILASEDIGLANPNALLLAQSTFEAVHKIGMPEARIILSQCTIYLATSPKSNSAYEAINLAMEEVKRTGDLSVPLNLRNAPSKLMKELGYGKEYKYSHGYNGNFVEQEFLPKGISNRRLYRPQDNIQERGIAERLKQWWGAKKRTK